MGSEDERIKINMEEGTGNWWGPPTDDEKHDRQEAVFGGGTVSVPPDRNRRPRAGVRGADRRAGAARERRWRRSNGWRGFIRTSEVGWGDRRAPIRAAHGHIIYMLGAAAGAGEGMDGGQWVDVRGVRPVFVHPERRWDTL